jgi:hypothetical protein
MVLLREKDVQPVKGARPAYALPGRFVDNMPIITMDGGSR